MTIPTDYLRAMAHQRRSGNVMTVWLSLALLTWPAPEIHRPYVCVPLHTLMPHPHAAREGVWRCVTTLRRLGIVETYTPTPGPHNLGVSLRLAIDPAPRATVYHLLTDWSRWHWDDRMRDRAALHAPTNPAALPGIDPVTVAIAHVFLRHAAQDPLGLTPDHATPHAGDRLWRAHLLALQSIADRFGTATTLRMAQLAIADPSWRAILAAPYGPIYFVEEAEGFRLRLQQETNA